MDRPGAFGGGALGNPGGPGIGVDERPGGPGVTGAPCTCAVTMPPAISTTRKINAAQLHVSALW